MNQDTLWLQVPAAKTHPVDLVDVSTTPDKLEHITTKLVSLQGYESPYLKKINIILFIADHGIENKDKIALTQAITSEALNKLSPTGDTSITIAEKLKAKLEIVNLGTKTDFKCIDGIIHSTLATSSANFCHSPAMSDEQFARSINIGRQSAQRVHLSGSQLFAASATSNRNISSVYALTCALLDVQPENLAGLNSEQHILIKQALELHKEQLTSPLEILRCLGSFEIAALTGSYLCCAHIGMPVLIDGIASAIAALITARICPEAEQWFLYTYTSADPAHKLILKSLSAQPLLQLNQTLDDIAGITSALSLLHLACANHNEIISFSKECLLKRYS